MNISAPFIVRPVATTLLTLGIALSGLLAFSKLPVSPLPQVDYPTISVAAYLPGASPETVASSVAAPLERHLGQIADVTEMTSQSELAKPILRCNSTSIATSTAQPVTCRLPSMPPGPICRRTCRVIQRTTRQIRPTGRSLSSP